jgi:TolB protein
MSSVAKGLSLVAIGVAGATLLLSSNSLMPPIVAAQSPAPASAPAERHLRSIRQLTFGGENAEAYFSPDGTRLIFQSTREGTPCDQIFTMKIDGTDLKRVSNGLGRTTCGYFYPGGKEIVFASTHKTSEACPPRPSFARGYVWPIYDGYEIYRANADGSNLRPLTTTPGYDAEATLAPDGTIAFTSVRDGDMEIYTMRADGTGVRRITNSPGPDGGPFFSWDGKRIAYRGRPLQPGTELTDYLALLKDHIWRPTKLELYVTDRDGKNTTQITKLSAASFAPSWHPDMKRLIFATNVKDPQQRNFDIFLINVDGTGFEQVTFNGTFDGFPMFSPNGRHLVFASNRNAKSEGETNVFIADWVE